MKGQTTYVEKKDQEKPIVLLAYKGENKEKNTQYLDIGANNHMCGFKNMFVKLDESESGHIFLRCIQTSNKRQRQNPNSFKK